MWHILHCHKLRELFYEGHKKVHRGNKIHSVVRLYQMRLTCQVVTGRQLVWSCGIHCFREHIEKHRFSGLATPIGRLKMGNEVRLIQILLQLAAFVRPSDLTIAQGARPSVLPPRYPGSAGNQRVDRCVYECTDLPLARILLRNYKVAETQSKERKQ